MNAFGTVREFDGPTMVLRDQKSMACWCTRMSSALPPVCLVPGPPAEALGIHLCRLSFFGPNCAEMVANVDR